MKVLPATLGASDEHYRRLGVSRDRIELWEDGMRTDGGKGTYEWWYFDAYLNDGSKLAITFRTKPIIDVGKALDPWIDFDLARTDGTSVVKHLHIEPERFSASKETCDVMMGSNSFKGDLHTYSIQVDAQGIGNSGGCFPHRHHTGLAARNRLPLLWRARRVLLCLAPFCTTGGCASHHSGRWRKSTTLHRHRLPRS